MNLQKSLGLKVGVYTGILLVAYSLFGQWIEYQTHEKVHSWIYLVLGIGIAYAFLEFKKLSGGFLKYKEGLSIGFWVSTVAGFILGLQYYIQSKFLGFPIITEFIRNQKESMIANKIPQLQIEETVKAWQLSLNSETYMLMEIFNAILLGFILSMILLTFMQKLPNQDENY